MTIPLKTSLLACISAVAATLNAAEETGAVQKDESEPVFVFLRPETSSFWNTATNSSLSFPVDYPVGAKSASLSVTGLGYSKTYTGITERSFKLDLPAPSSPSEENVYDLVLEFDNGEQKTARLGLVEGLRPDGEGCTRVIAPANDAKWGKALKRAVIPIPFGTGSFTVQTNGGETENIETGLGGAQGWYALKLPAGANLSLSLSTPDGETHAANITCLFEGLYFTIK
jgi:hypothetical protein